MLKLSFKYHKFELMHNINISFPLISQPGLTMVVGPPGTGKTDVAVQIISNLYHNFPDQRTLIVTHSNQVGRVLELSINTHRL